MKRPLAATALMGLATLAALVLVALHLVPFGMPQVWTWGYQPLQAPQRALFPLAGLAVLGVVLRGPVRLLLTEPPTRARECKALLGLWVAALTLSLSVALMHPAGFMQLTTLMVNPASNSYYTTALQYPDTPELLNGYEHKMRGFVSHAQTQTAGPVVLCGVLHRVLGAVPGVQDIADTLLALAPGVNTEAVARLCGQWWQVSISPPDVAVALFVALTFIGVGGLAVAPIYLLGKWLHNPATGVFAATGFTVLPAFHSFTPAVDQIYPLVTACVLAMAWRAVLSAERGWMWMGAAGLFVSWAIFMNLGLLTLVPLTALLWACGNLRSPDRPAVGPSVAAMVACGAGIAIPFVVLWLTVHFNILAVFRTSDQMRDQLYMGKHRSYGASLFGNLWDFFAFCGVPVTALYGWHIWGTLRSVTSRAAPLSAALAAAPLTWALIPVLIALDLSGKTRGEVGRMWMFLMPCVLLGAAASGAAATGAMGDSEDGPERRGVLAAIWLLLQFSQVVVFQYFVRVWGY